MNHTMHCHLCCICQINLVIGLRKRCKNWMSFFSKNKFDLFINDSRHSSIEGINRVKNAWKVYKNNNYHPFKPIKNSFDSDFSLEIEKLKSLSVLETKVNDIENQLDSSERKTVTILQQLKQKIKSIRTELDGIGLYIIKTGNLAKRINDLDARIR